LVGRIVNADSGGSFATLTHARLRAAQGDVTGAVRILRVILEVQPGHDEARGFLAEIEHRVAIVHAEPLEIAEEAVMPAAAGALSLLFREALDAHRPAPRIPRLLSWLERIQRQRGEHHVR
jgi:hypothetical protein